MQPLSSRSRIVSERRLSLAERLYLPAIFRGMAITLGHLFRKKVTVRYPEEERPRSPVYRGLHVLKRDDAGAERCTACGLCALACPAEAITMTAKERTPDEAHLYREEKYAATYEINMLRCIFCGLCEEACPKEAIFLTDRLVPSEFERGDFVYGKDRLVEPLDRRVNVSERQTPETLAFKQRRELGHNRLRQDALPAPAERRKR